MNDKKNKFENFKIIVPVISTLLFLMLTVPLYSRPKVEISLSNVSPDYPEWYKRYDLNLTLNPSAHFGFRVKFGTLDFAYEEFSINYSLYGGIRGLLYFPHNNVTPYIFLRLHTYYHGASDYEGSSYYLYTIAGLGVDWYFSNRIGCSAELDNFLMCYLSKYDGETTANMDMHPRIIIGLKFNIY